MKYILDNSNLAESYSGVTTPLTYSFASHVYREVYKSFCERMGVSKKVVAQNGEVFSNFLCFVGYRMYYNLGNWYTAISLLPAYRFNKYFFDRMLGVDASNSERKSQASDFLKRYFIELPRVTGQILRMGATFILMETLVRRFNHKFDNIFSKLESMPLKQLEPEDLVQVYAYASKELLSRWWIPIANDFAVMVSTGLARKALIKWINQTEAGSQLHLEAHGSLVSLDPTRCLMNLVKAIKRDPAILKLLLDREDPASLFKELTERFASSETCRLMQEYLAKYGARVPNELKLESETLKERPEIIMSLLRTLVQTEPFEMKEGQFRKLLALNRFPSVNLVKRILLRGLLSWAGNSIRRREETRFRRALIFGYIRALYLAMSDKFHKASIIAEPGDIFYLTEDEIFGLATGTRKPEDVTALIEYRKAELLEWKGADLPRRMETDETLDELLARLKSFSGKNQAQSTASILKGSMVARNQSAVVRGTALVLTEFSSTASYNNKVLVTCQTDPGWTIIFPFVKALIVERGGVLSHAAIVARELGIPCVVGVEGATSSIPDGATVEILSDTGEIRIQPDYSELAAAAGSSTMKGDPWLP